MRPRVASVSAAIRSDLARPSVNVLKRKVLGIVQPNTDRKFCCKKVRAADAEGVGVEEASEDTRERSFPI